MASSSSFSSFATTLHYFVVLLWLSTVCSPVFAADNFGIFSTPPEQGPNRFFNDNPVFQLGSKVTLGWSTAMEVWQMNVWQQALEANSAIPSSRVIRVKNADQSEPGNIDWTVQTYELDLDVSNVFFLGITASGNLSEGFASHYFNITSEAVSSVIPSASSSSSSSTSTSTASSTPSPSGVDGKDGGNANANANANSNDTDSLRIGLGVGLGLGIPLVALAAFVAAYAFLRRRRNPAAVASSGAPSSIAPTPTLNGSPGHMTNQPYFASGMYTPTTQYPSHYPGATAGRNDYTPTYAPIAQLDSNERMSELPGDNSPAFK